MTSPQVVYNPFTNNLDLTDIGTVSGNPYPGGVKNWIDAMISQTMTANNGYVADSSSLVILTLPTTAAFGDYFRIVGNGSGGWKIAQNAGQRINLGGISSTVGVTGFISSTNQFDCVDILCVSTNSEFTVISGPQGNLNVN